MNWLEHIKQTFGLVHVKGDDLSEVFEKRTPLNIIKWLCSGIIKEHETAQICNMCYFIFVWNAIYEEMHVWKLYLITI